VAESFHSVIIILMGVTGAGKTTVGRLLASDLGHEFIDADDYHPPENVAKMRAGQPLTDDDRWPWLRRLNEVLRGRAAAVVACSALKESYRTVLMRGLPHARLVYLRGTKAVIAARVAERRGHYMNPALLDSQFATLEEPRDAIVADIDQAPEAIVASIMERLAASGRPR
jgi:gluconokinase